MKLGALQYPIAFPEPFTGYFKISGVNSFGNWNFSLSSIFINIERFRTSM